MPRTLQTPPDAEHEAQVAEQAQIESQVTTDPPAAPTDPDAAGDSSAPNDEQAPEVAAEQDATATLKSVNVDEYPIHVGLAQGEYTFENADQTIEVPLEVAEQVTYIPVVEVVA